MSEPDQEAKDDQEQGQYERLKRCSEKGEEGIKEWNEWRKQNPTEDIRLDEQDSHGWYLRGVNLMRTSTCDATGKNRIEYSGQIYLRRANFQDADVEACGRVGAHLEGTYWWYAKARGANFTSAKLNDARLGVSQLDECRFDDAVFSGAELTDSSLRGAKFQHSDLRGCSARGAITDGATIIWECRIDDATDFTGVSLDSVRTDAGTKQGLEYAIRRRNWERWYRVGRPDYVLRRPETVREVQVRKAQETRRCILTSPVRMFWLMSDYGGSAGRIVSVFFGLACAFAALYYLAAILNPPGVVTSLLEGKEGAVQSWLVPVRAIYFSVVTMTTLGFGDMHANCRSLWGHVLLTSQVLLGYVLLAALVTRFAVLFTAGGPAGKFAKAKSKIKNQNAK